MTLAALCINGDAVVYLVMCINDDAMCITGDAIMMPYVPPLQIYSFAKANF